MEQFRKNIYIWRRRIYLTALLELHSTTLNFGIGKTFLTWSKTCPDTRDVQSVHQSLACLQVFDLKL